MTFRLCSTFYVFETLALTTAPSGTFQWLQIGKKYSLRLSFMEFTGLRYEMIINMFMETHKWQITQLCVTFHIVHV